MELVQRPSQDARLDIVEYRVLGPVSAYLGAKPRQLGGKRQRMVLAVLLTRPNEIVSQDWLIDAVWGGEPPPAAKQTLHTYVSTLRKILDGGIEREGDGYIVRMEGNQLDSLNFESLVQEGRALVESSPSRASELLSDALSLWHGPAFGDLNGETALINEGIRLDEARLAAVEYRIEADLDSGDHSAVVQELEAMTREHPFRERLHGFLMLALYRSGRQGDALRAYRRAQNLLAEELGIDPSPDLQALEEKILSQDPDLDWTGSTRAHSPSRAARGYELREQVGENEYGTVHRGFQGSVGREVAVLSLRDGLSDDTEFVRRFESELRATSQLEHPNIVPVFDFWRDPEGAYLVTAYLRGGSLRDAVGVGTWNLSSALRMIDQVGSALGFAHRNGFVHGNLGVDSIGLDLDGNAYITDFGISSLRTASSDRSSAGDVYALAGLARYVLAGEPGATVRGISEVRPDLAVLDHVFARALHADPASRYQKPEDLARAMRQAAGADVVSGVVPSSDDQRRNPYKSLRAFQESDASDFYGRDALIQDLLKVLSTKRILAVVGPSGSGKSSLVRAGLLAALRRHGVDGSSGWMVTEMFPGTHPFEELEAAILRVAVDRPVRLFEDLTSDSRGFVRIAKQILPDEDSELLLVVDQFEELFSLTGSESARRLFLDSLVAAVSDERSRVRVVLTLRADFFDQPLRYTGFDDVLRDGLVPIGPPSDDGLARAIVQPARSVGVDLEPGLVTRIVDDVRDQPGGLPLLQYALTELFAQREHNTLTLAAYERTGGVLGALGKRAEEIYQDLPEDGRDAARQLFLRLVTVDELADDTRRRVRQTELKGLELNQAALDDVIHRFGAFRLLSFDRDAATRTPTIEVAHEALIREWARLRTWIDDRREDLLIHRRIQVTARDWEDSAKDASYLLRGSRLEQALTWKERTDIAISADEMTFIEASIEQEKRDLAEHEALEAKAIRRRKAVIGVLAGGLVVAGVLGAVALNSARSERITAARATARELSAAATNAIEQDSELAILIALEAIAATDLVGLEPVPEAASAIREALRATRVRMRFQDSFTAVTYSPDGSIIISDSGRAGLLRLVEAQTGDLIREVSVYDQSWAAAPDNSGLAFSEDGDDLAVSWGVHPLFAMRPGDRSEPPPSMVGVSIHGFPEFESRIDLFGPAGGYGRASFGAGGLVAASFSDIDNNGRAIVWDSNSGEVVASFGPEPQITGASFIPGTDTLVLSQSGGRDQVNNALPGRLVAFDVSNPGELWSLSLSHPVTGSEPSYLTLSPDGSKAAVSYRDLDLFELIDLRRRESLGTFENADVQATSWDATGTRIAVSGATSEIAIHDEGAQWERTINLRGQGGAVFGIAFSPDGHSLVSAALGRDGIVWDTTAVGAVGDRAVHVGGDVGLIFTGPDPNRLVVGVLGEGPQIVTVDPFSLETVGLNSHFHFKPNIGLSAVAGSAFEGEETLGVVANIVDHTEWHPAPSCLIPMAVSERSTMVVLDAVSVCGETVSLSSGLYEVETGEILVDLGRVALFKASMSPDDTYLVVNSFTALTIYSLDTYTAIASYSAEELDVPGFLTLDISPEGRYLGIGTQDTKAIVLDVHALMTDRPKLDAVVFNQSVSELNVPQVRVNDAGIAAAIGFDGIYRLWDTNSGERLFEIRAPQIAQGSARFIWDGSELVYEDGKGNIRWTPLATTLVVDQARAVLTRTLSDEECTRYLHTDGCES